MKKRLALQPDYKKIQSDEIDNVISTLKNHFIPDEHANEISERLYTSLENGCLDLEACEISDEILSQILPLLSVLNITKLNLSKNEMLFEGATALAKTLETNTSIKELNLHSNQIGPKGVKALAKTLKINHSLTHINLNNNQIQTEGTIYIADALQTNTSLTHLDIYRNQIGPKGATALAKSLKINTSLKGLYIGNNNIGDAGAKELADALKINASLKELKLWINGIGSDGSTDIAEALKINISLTHINLDSNKLGNDLKKAIYKELEINEEIATFKELKEDYLLKMYLDPKKLFFTHLNSDLEKLISEFLIDSHYEISKDAVSKLQTISKRKYAATRIQKIVRGHQVRINQDTNPRNIRNCLSLLIQTTTNCFTLKNTTNIKKIN